MPARSFPLRLFATFIPAMVAVAGCSTPPGGMQLLSAAEIAQAGQGSLVAPDNAALLARAARLSDRAATLRRTSIGQHRGRSLRERAELLAGR